MKKQSIRVSIPKPCHEDWDKMDTTEKGAFCHSCQREVIDFSRMSDRQVIEYLAGSRKVCGNFRQDQVARQMTLYRPQQGYTNWKVYMLAMLPLMSFTCHPLHDTTGTKGEPAPTQHVVMGKIAMTRPVAPESDTIITISGRVLDGDGHPLQGAEVSMTDTVTFSSVAVATTDTDGQYSIRLSTQNHNYSRQKLSAYHSSYRGDMVAIDSSPHQQHDIILDRVRPMLRGEISIDHSR